MLYYREYEKIALEWNCEPLKITGSMDNKSPSRKSPRLERHNSKTSLLAETTSVLRYMTFFLTVTRDNFEYITFGANIEIL